MSAFGRGTALQNAGRESNLLVLGVASNVHGGLRRSSIGRWSLNSQRVRFIERHEDVPMLGNTGVRTGNLARASDRTAQSEKIGQSTQKAQSREAIVLEKFGNLEIWKFGGAVGDLPPESEIVNPRHHRLPGFCLTARSPESRCRSYRLGSFARPNRGVSGLASAACPNRVVVESPPV
jgi:hypothetical protein